MIEVASYVGTVKYIRRGISAISYEIALDTNSITADGETGEFLTTNLGNFRFIKHVGGDSEEQQDICSTYNYLVMFVGSSGNCILMKKPDGSTSYKYSSSRGNSSISDAMAACNVNEGSIRLIKFMWYDKPIKVDGSYDYIDNLCRNLGVPSDDMQLKILASNTLTVVQNGVDGKPGEPGAPGARGSSGPVWRRHIGFVSATADAPYQYYAGNNDERFLDVVLINKVWYRCLRSYMSIGTDDVRNTPANAEFAKYWTSADMAGFTFIATQLLLAENAKINLFGSNEINLYGSDAEGKIFASFRVPNGNGDDSLYALWIGAETGAVAPFSVTKDGSLFASNGIFAGELRGVTGSFHKLTAVSSDGKKNGGSIYFDSDDITFDADIYSQGYNYAAKRGWRFYAGSIWCRLAFGHRQSTLAVVIGDVMRVYPDGYDCEYISVNLEHVSYDNKTVYKIPLFGGSGDLAGCPIDVVVFNSRRAIATYHYEFVPGGTGKRWMAINANDHNDGIHFCDVGGWHQLYGGETINLVYINPELLNPSQKDKTYLGRGIFWSGEQNLDWSRR